MKDAANNTQATISATTYLRDDVSNPSARSVILAFNGGPGASSSPLHFSLLGPRLQTPPDATGARQFIANPETLLDAADLVLIDPVGTDSATPSHPMATAPTTRPLPMRRPSKA